MKGSLVAAALLAGSAGAALAALPLEVLGVPLGAVAQQLQQTIPLFRCHTATCTFDPVNAASGQCEPVSSDPPVLDCYAQSGSK